MSERDRAIDVVDAASTRIAATELWRRTAIREVAEIPAGGPPIVVLAPETFTASLLGRRLAFCRLAGWVPDRVDRHVAGRYPDLPPEADVADHLAVALAAAGPTDDSGDVRLATLLAVLRDPEARDPSDLRWWAEALDACADALRPGWRQRTPVPTVAPVHARLEAVTRQADAWFGHRRRRSPWPSLHRLTGAAGDVRRRLGR